LIKRGKKCGLQMSKFLHFDEFAGHFGYNVSLNLAFWRRVETKFADKRVVFSPF